MGRVVVLGAGIIGLYTSLLLAELGLGHDTVVVAKHMPGDLSTEYTSPIAGAHFSCSIAGDSDEALKWCKVSYQMLKRVFKKFENNFEAAGLDRLKQVELFGEPLDSNVVQRYKAVVDNYEEIKDEAWLHERGANFGIKYDTFNFYPPKFLRFLKEYLEGQGVRFVRSSVSHISEVPRAASVPKPAAVFNCTGVMIAKLGGVSDSQATYPIRGQVVSVRAPWIKENISLQKKGNPPTYIIPRVHSGGRVILGGYYDAGDWTEGTIAEQTKSIIERTAKLNPSLLQFGVPEIVEERSGLRPGRDGGARVQRETIGDLVVIHNYGAAGTGFQCGLGMAQEAVNLFLNPSSKL